MFGWVTFVDVKLFVVTNAIGLFGGGVLAHLQSAGKVVHVFKALLAKNTGCHVTTKSYTAVDVYFFVFRNTVEVVTDAVNFNIG